MQPPWPHAEMQLILHAGVGLIENQSRFLVRLATVKVAENPKRCDGDDDGLMLLILMCSCLIHTFDIENIAVFRNFYGLFSDLKFLKKTPGSIVNCEHSCTRRASVSTRSSVQARSHDESRADSDAMV